MRVFSHAGPPYTKVSKKFAQKIFPCTLLDKKNSTDIWQSLIPCVSRPVGSQSAGQLSMSRVRLRDKPIAKHPVSAAPLTPASPAIMAV